jgi:hypothetical protein
MAATTVAVSLTNSAYTALSAGHGTVLVKANLPTRIAIAASQPAVGTDDWYPLAADTEFAMQGLGASDNVYGLPDGPSGSITASVAHKVRVARA